MFCSFFLVGKRNGQVPGLYYVIDVFGLLLVLLMFLMTFKDISGPDVLVSDTCCACKDGWWNGFSLSHKAQQNLTPQIN